MSYNAEDSTVSTSVRLDPRRRLREGLRRLAQESADTGESAVCIDVELLPQHREHVSAKR